MSIQIRLATEQDVSEIVRLLADDVLGVKRERYEDPLPSVYYAAVEIINSENCPHRRSAWLAKNDVELERIQNKIMDFYYN